jgi:hypothetical protein
MATALAVVRPAARVAWTSPARGRSVAPPKGFRRWASARPVSRPSHQPATGPPGSYPDRTSAGQRRRAHDQRLTTPFTSSCGAHERFGPTAEKAFPRRRTRAVMMLVQLTGTVGAILVGRGDDAPGEVEQAYPVENRARALPHDPTARSTGYAKKGYARALRRTGFRSAS